MIYKILIVIFILSAQLCLCQIDKTGEDKTHLIAEYDLLNDVIPYNITLYKDPDCKYIQTILNYTCRYYNSTINNRRKAECTTQTTLDNSINIWGSEIKSCVTEYNSFKKESLDQCNYQSEAMYNVIYKPFDVKFLNSPPTRGGLVNVTGYFMRVGNLDVSKVWLNFDPFNGWLYISLDVLGNYNDPNYNPNSLTIKYVRGYGIQKLCLDRNYLNCYKIAYQSPSISNTYYNHTFSQITIYGNNFYNESKVINITLGGTNITKNDFISADFEKIVIKHPSTQTQILNIQLYIDSLSTFSNVTIKPLPLSSTSNVTRYNNGIVEIIGTHLSAPDLTSTINITINNKNCMVIYNNSTYIQCKLTKEGADNKQHILQVCINGICNENELLFEYGKPTINQIVQNEKIFTLYGQNQGSFNDKSTQLLLKYNNDINNLTISPILISNNESVSSFEIPFFCGNASAQLIVNGVLSNFYTIIPKPLLEIQQLPSTDSKDSLNVLISYYDCKFYNNGNPKFKSSQVQGNRANNTIYYSFNVGEGSGHKSELLLFADQEIQFEYSYAKPVLLNHSINISLNSENILTINGNNFGKNSSLCKVSYHGITLNCQVDNHYQIKFKVDKLEISANVYLIIDGIQSDNYTLELVNCDLLIDTKYPTTFGCLNSTPAVLYICKGLTSFKSKTNSELLHATINDQEIKIIIKNDNVTIPIPEGSKSSILKLYLNGLFSESYQINRKEGEVFKSNMKFYEKDNSINLYIQGMNFGEPYSIQLPSLLNFSIDSKNCSLLYHGTVDNQLCTSDIINCQISLPNDFNKTILLNHVQSSNYNSSTIIPFILSTGNSIIKSNISSIEHTHIQDNNHTKLALAIALPIGLVALIVGGVFGGYKYHKYKIDNSKKKNIQ